MSFTPSSSWALAAVQEGDSLVSEFEPTDREQWRAGVDAAALGTAARMDGVTEDGLPVAALYTAADAGSTSQPQTPRVVAVGRLHTDGDAAQVHAAVLADGARGVQTAWIRLTATQRAGCAAQAGAPGITLGSDAFVRLAHAGAPVLVHGDAAASALLRALPPQHGVLGVLADPLGCLAETGASAVSVETDMARLVEDTRWAVAHHPAVATALVSTAAYHDAGATDVQEVGIAVATGLAVFGALQDAGISPDDAAARIVMLLAVGHEPFRAIAKLRAARRLWTRVLAHAGAPAVPPRIWAQSSARTRTRWAVANNLLRATLEAFAAATGGADGALILPHTHAVDAAGDTPDQDAQRLAVNAQLLLRDESGLSHVSDPAAGSWAIEARTDALGRAAWAYAQRLVAGGGVAAALREGTLQRDIHQAATRRAHAVAVRKLPVTGVTIFPEAAESRPAAMPATRPSAASSVAAGQRVQPLVPQSLTRTIESLREAAQSAPRTPRAALVRLAAPADVLPQVDFADGVLVAGGLATQAVGPDLAELDAGTFDVAVLCGTAEHLAASGPAAAQAAQAAGIAYVLVAGRPDAHERALRAAGVADFVHRGSDIEACVTAMHVALGLSQAPDSQGGAA